MYHVKEDELKQKCIITILIGAVVVELLLFAFIIDFIIHVPVDLLFDAAVVFFCLLYFVDVILSTINDNS